MKKRKIKDDNRNGAHCQKFCSDYDIKKTFIFCPKCLSSVSYRIIYNVKNCECGSYHCDNVCKNGHKWIGKLK